MARRTKAEAERTRTAILNAAERVFLAKGVADTSLEDIAAAAKVTRGAIYWHFKNKEDLFEAMHIRVKLPIDALFEIDPECSALDCSQYACIEATKDLATNKRARNVFTIIITAEQSCQMKGCMERQLAGRQKMLKKFEALMTRAHKQGELAKGVKPKTATIALTSFLCGLLSDSLKMPSLYPINKLAEELIGVFFRGLRADNTNKKCA